MKRDMFNGNKYCHLREAITQLVVRLPGANDAEIGGWVATLSRNLAHAIEEFVEEPVSPVWLEGRSRGRKMRSPK